MSIVANWSNGLPNAFSTVIIDDTANPPMLVSGTMTVGRLINNGPDDISIAAGATLELAQPEMSSIIGGSLTLDGTLTGAGSLQFSPSATFTFSDGTISTEGRVVANGTTVITGSNVRIVDSTLVLAGATTFGSSATINGIGDVQITGTTTVPGTGSTISNDVMIGSAGVLQMNGTGNVNMDFTGSSFVNNGLILLGGSSTNTLEIDVTNATIINEGTIQFTNTEVTGIRKLRGNIENHGTIDVDANAYLIGSAAEDLLVDARIGSIDIAAGVSLVIGSGSAVEDVIVGPNTVLTGSGTLDMTVSNNLLVDGSFIYTASMPTLVMGSAVAVDSYGGGLATFTVATGATLDISNIEYTAIVDLVNYGTLTTSGAFDIKGGFVNHEGSLLSATAGAITNYLKFGDSINNFGTITIDEPDNSTSFIQFNVSGRKEFNNYGTFSITQSGTSSGTTATINADVRNY